MTTLTRGRQKYKVASVALPGVNNHEFASNCILSLTSCRVKNLHHIWSEVTRTSDQNRAGAVSNWDWRCFPDINTFYSDDTYTHIKKCTFLICSRFLPQQSVCSSLVPMLPFFFKVLIISSIYHGCEVFASGWMEDLCYIVVSKWDYSAETRWCIFAVHDKDGHLWCLCCHLIPSLLYIPAEITHTAEVMFSSFFFFNAL